jgi:hypothetical protein
VRGRKAHTTDRPIEFPKITKVPPANRKIEGQATVHNSRGLTEANLRGADLRNADLGEANLRDAVLRGANLGGANIEAATLVNTDLTGADLTGCRIHGVSAWCLKLDTRTEQRPTGESQPSGRTPNWIKLGGKVNSNRVKPTGLWSASTKSI